MKSILFGLLLGAMAILGMAAAQDTMGGQVTMGGQSNMGGEGTMGAHTVSVTITNSTAHQSFSAPVLVAHSREYTPFALGEPVYPELIPLAEDGMTGDFLTVAKVDPAILDVAVAKDPLAPGQSVTLQIRVDDSHPLLSAFGMLVTTNDTVFYFGADLSMSSASGADAMGSGGTTSESMSGDAQQMGSDSMGTDQMGSSDMGAGSDAMGSDSMGSDSMGSDSMGSDSMGSDSMGSDSMASGSDAMMAHVDLYDGTVRALDAGSEANTESCHDIPGPPCGSVGVRHQDMAEGAVAISQGLKGDGDLDPAVYGWRTPVAEVTLSTP